MIADYTIARSDCMEIKVKLEFDVDKIMKQKQGILDKTQSFLDQRVLNDSNYFIPMQEGFLKNSGHVVKRGQIEWSAEYARKQYYGLPNKSKQVNPNASMKWFEQAKARKMKEWERIANGEYNK